MLPWSDWSSALEITDLLVDVDPESMERQPVRTADIQARLTAVGDAWGLRLIRRLPASRGVLDTAAVDALLIRVHAELSRLGQEFAQPARLRYLLGPLVDELRRSGHGRPIRVADIGCGVGYTVRWLARYGDLGDDVELVGFDYNPALVAEARRLARLDRVRCRFECADALRVPDPPAIVTSSGVLHHFRGAMLREFFSAHDPTAVRAFLHYDVTPTHPWLRYLGAWVFHLARMRLAISRHDGVISAMRAHPDRDLVDAAVDGAPWAAIGIYGSSTWGSPFVALLLLPWVADRRVS